MLKTAVRSGFKPNDFWDLTPEEYSIVIEAKNEDRKEHYKDLIFLAWHVEVLARQKKLPKLEQLTREKKAKQTSEQMIAIVRALNVAFGGEEL